MGDRALLFQTHHQQYLQPSPEVYVNMCTVWNSESLCARVRHTIHQTMSVYVCVHVCVHLCMYLQHLACWVQGAELSTVKDVLRLHTLSKKLSQGYLRGCRHSYTPKTHSKAHSHISSMRFYLARMSTTPLSNQPYLKDTHMDIISI